VYVCIHDGIFHYHATLELLNLFICIWQGVVNNKEFLEMILKKYEIDIVISAIGAESLLDQLTLVEAMKSIKTIKV
jgi:hypothetical protein